MTPEFESQKHQKNSFGDSPDPCCGARDMEKRDRFELLSAYLDGEVSATERKQVEDWLQPTPRANAYIKDYLICVNDYAVYQYQLPPNL